MVFGAMLKQGVIVRSMVLMDIRNISGSWVRGRKMSDFCRH
ncbi:MAG: hypothetical protein R2860_12035 [Desulfobacterales bacterium]